MSYLIFQPVVCALDASGFDGSTASFTNLLPAEPSLTDTHDVTLMHSGVGALKRVASAPSAGEFTLSGGTHRTVTFGLPPETGDTVHAIYVAA